MSKNLTRKGLALGAVVALGSTLFAGAPAQAAGELNLQPSVGTTYGTIIGQTFTLSVNTNPGYASSELTGKLKYAVTNASKAALTINTGVTSNLSSSGVTAGTDNATYTVAAQNISTSAANLFTVATAASATSTVVVQAWVDSDFDNVIDGNEWVSAAQNVVFNKASEVTWTTEFTAPVIGDTKYLTYVSAAPSINLAQFATAVDVTLKEDSTAVDKDLTFDSTTGKLKFNDVDSTIGSVEAGKRYSAQAKYSSANVGSEVAYAVAAATIGSIDAPVTEDSDNTKTTATAVAVRDSATSVPVSILVKDSSAAALKNTDVTIYVEESAIGGTDTNATTAVGNYDTSSFSAGGQTLKDAAAGSTKEKISFVVKTDADGKATFSLTASAKAGDAVKIWAAAQGVNSTPTNSATYTWTSATVASVKNLDLNGASAVLKQAAGSTFTLNFAVLDQFGAAIPTADKYRVAVSDGSYQSSDNNFYPVVSAGKASQSITLASTASGTKTYAFKVQTKGADGNYADASVVGTAVSLVVGTSNAAGSVALQGDVTTWNTYRDLSSTDTNTVVVQGSRTSGIDTVAFVAGDKDAGATNSVKATTTTGVKVQGTVKDATTAGTYSTVTLSGANLNFIVDGTLYAVGAVTVQTDSTGAFGGIQVVTTKAGKQTLTVTAGSATKSYVIDFGAAAATAGTALAVTAPATIEPGKTLTVSAVLTDKFGNAVDVADGKVSVSYDGPGLRVDALPTQTDADGKLQFRVLLGASDTGSATATIKVDTNADGDFTDTTDITKTASIAIAAPVVVVPEVKTTIVGVTKAVRIRVENAKGEEVEVKFGSKTVAVAIAGTNSKLWVLKTTKGKKSVKVYVDGDLVAVKTVTVK